MQPSLASLSESTSTFRHRVTDALISLLFPRSGWRRYWNNRRVVDADGEDRLSQDEVFSDEEGEGMVGFDIHERERRRAALERIRGEEIVGERRLSRELEQGFCDDSTDEEEDGREGEHHHSRTGIERFR
jgi:hypothetical protein